MTGEAGRWRRGLMGLLMLLQAGSPVQTALAQSDFDSEPPLIEHEVDPILEPGMRQVFEASVVDDVGLEAVTFFYRLADSDTDFIEVPMTRILTSSSYRAVVGFDDVARQDIEYYIEATDASGNRTFRGFVFSPLIRRAPPARQTRQAVSTDAAIEATSDAQASEPKSRKVLYFVLGTLAVGVIAGLAASAGGDSDSGSSGSGECPPSGCELTLTVQEPF